MMKWNSIRTKLILFLLLPTLLCIAATMVINYSYTTRSLQTRAVEENKNLLFQGARNISGMLEEINRLSLTVYSDAEFYRLLEVGSEDISANVRIYAALNYISTSSPDIHQVYLYGEKGAQSTLVTTNSTPKRWQGRPPFPDSALTGESATAVQSTHPSNSYGFQMPLIHDTEVDVFTFHRRIERIPTPEPLGYLSIDVRLTALSEIVEQLYEQNQEKLFVVDGEGMVVYAADGELTGGPLQEEWFRTQVQAEGGDQGYFEQDGAVFIYQKVDGPGQAWTLVKQIPEAYLFREAKEAATINIALLALLLVMITALIIFISFRMTAPIKQLTRYMNQVRTGKLDVEIRPAGKDEIGALTEHFRHTMDTINNLILREYRLELSNKTNELKALQAQINPHFLNNTLQIIGTLALELNTPQIYSLLSALAKMMRYSMHNGDKIVTVQDELDHVKAYLELQRERFENRFAFRYDMEEGLSGAAMPKMMLQPVVENYFKHGFRLDRTDGLVEIKGRRLGTDRMEVAIWNNGPAIPAAKLEELRLELAASVPPNIGELDADGTIAEEKAGQADASEAADSKDGPHHEVRADAPGTGIGLANVLARLRLVCGEDASLTVENRESGGVCVRLEFEIRMESER